ncbi:putative tetratricopeptide-like helical domain superfamily [Helianthus annuus]|uniref:Tetratricopeptide-like helical domain superfamily n=1 Tax=Helianthus annuus TaxID=4232 RepID=A0A9K3JQN3_HELAN|nr:putative tetratricopeptide-like helical domain superfamily [Helianthus annuus]KAJ0940702.1 putative tetratricopeptide-like helical domain superfamily [Helianthus annuus]KAJ0952459.1 putative tetratricopeptide-like helical domain superfamily [Helianthus annuus]
MIMYSLFDKMGDARYVFDEMPRHYVVLWTVLISGYAKIGDVEVQDWFLTKH